MPDPPLTPGAALPERECSCDLVQAVRLAGATANYHRIHWDHDYARAAGLSGAVVHGGLLMAWLEALVEDAYGPAARLTHLDVRYRRPVLVDERIRRGGSVEQAVHTATGLRLTVRLWLRDAAGEVCAEATAAVELPA